MAQGPGADKISLVHLDLKGAPPKLVYYEQLFPLLKQWGAGGLLVEYEDMFPYWGELEILQAKNMYRQEEIRQIVTLAKQNDLIVTPLVPTFGHLEFLLKHEKFRHLREVPKYPMSLCPLNPESLIIVGQMIDQVLSLHPESNWFHIGGDEVFHIGCCEQCKAFNADDKQDKELYLYFTGQVLKLMKEKYPDKTCIMWDDMLRNRSLHQLKASGIGDLVEPMVWQYSQQLELPEDIWCRYSQVFPSVWIATAYKGATGPAQQATNIAYHIENHKAWVSVASQVATLFKNFRGYALTGWQR
ncbi:hexosaminidase D-like isoform X1 [Lingula anatina]|uniref:beta-N-acetylhexosaminidase n=2 Tax=Lingula anatina TaxID=7574 RepID=A0A1S3JFC5_LINAN|nr:hexosaminidase D-like isoform X1 [Lingula anatina]|eukprot:XP_013408589.1 hexosaminidase D-like isoform X1 [Lingula anatina]